MKQRVARKILKFREILSYSEHQIEEAEETLREIENRRAKREVKAMEEGVTRGE